jgi:hypothetical protein
MFNSGPLNGSPVMRQRNSTATAPVQRNPHGVVAKERTAPFATGTWIRMRLAVATGEVFALRQLLQRAVGHLARIYVVHVDHKHGETTVHLEVARGDREVAMDAIMAGLPAAEFGFISSLDPGRMVH